MKLSDFRQVEAGMPDLKQLVARFNDTTRPYPRDETVHGLFAKQAAERPDAVALVHGEAEHTYRQLDEASNRFARFLINRGLEREGLVALLLERPFEMLAAILGVLKAGGAYVPLDHSMPFDRIRHLLDSSATRILASEKRYLQMVNRLQCECSELDIVFCVDSRDVHREQEHDDGFMHEARRGGANGDAILHVDSDTKADAAAPARRKLQYDLRALDEYSGSKVAERSGPEGLAYVIYTSGTSGQPKGVMVEHRAILRLVVNTDYAQLQPDDRVLQTGPVAFDASTFEMWGPLLNGGALCRPPERAILDPAEVVRLIAKHRITTMFITTSLFNQYVDSDINMFAGLKYLLTGGEPASSYHFNKVHERYPRLMFSHVYGPTENTTFTTHYPIKRRYSGNVPIGRPIANSQVLILDSSGSLVPVGVPGEICAAGDGLARGYLNEPELTRQKFVTHPSQPGARVYRTGDSGLWRADGTIEFLGRLDDQVKIRGFRIEPAEIEHHILRHPAVKQAVVIAKALNGGKELVAYVTLKAASDEVKSDELREWLARFLPGYMLPSHIMCLKRMPLNANGKVDRPLLPDPAGEQQQPTASSCEPPATETEREVLAIWEEVLGRSQIGVTDNFFDRGGHSLRIAKALALVERRLGVAVPLAMFFTYPTVRGLAAYILDSAKFGVAGIDDAMVPLSVTGGSPTLFAFPPGTGDALGFAQFASLLPCRCYGFNFIEADSRLGDYADLVTRVDAHGPYVLFGYSSGGNLAYHVARELEQRGRRVIAIIMLDSARRLHPMPMPEQEIDRTTARFLGDESVQPYLTSPILRDKAERMIRSSLRHGATTVDYHTINADIHVVTDENPDQEDRDADGRLVTSQSGWKDVTRGQLYVYRGFGSHNHMLAYPDLDGNVTVVQKLLDRIARSEATRSDEKVAIHGSVKA